MNALEKNLQEIINSHAESIMRYTEGKNELSNKIRFCTEHKFLEEARIARIERDAMEMVLYNYSQMNQQLAELLNKWLS